MLTREIFQQAMDRIDHAVIICNEHLKFIYWNEAAKKILLNYETVKDDENWQRKYGIFRMDMETRYSDDDLPIVRAVKKGTVAKEKIFVTNEEIPDGVYLQVDSFPVINEKGIIIAGVASFNDITKEIKIEKFVDDLSKKLDHLMMQIKKHFLNA